ncbi:MAG TPA: hypothetical protein VET87_06400 [Rubrivivax sp.]|nr:hypothetical protein [Rubrivivax sp.]
MLELYLADTRQLFNSMDPAPFRKRDLDPKAAEYIVDWAREAPKGQPLSLVVHLGQQAKGGDDGPILRDAVHDYFAGRAIATRKGLRQLFRIGRISLLIGLAFMGLMMLAGQAAYSLFSREAYAVLIKESLIISGWVALWRPAEIFLHEWWPILGEARLYDRLAVMPVSLHGANAPVEQAA